MSAWRTYCERFLTITPREQYLIIGSGIAVIFFAFFNLYLESAQQEVQSIKKDISQIQASNQSNLATIKVLEEALEEDPNADIIQQITKQKNELAEIDSQLASLASEMIDPIQMRSALMALLDLQRGISLVSFEALPAKAMLNKTQDLPANSVNANKHWGAAEQTQTTLENTGPEKLETIKLYKHGMRLTLSGGYFQLRDYLKRVEDFEWKFFWHSFEYRLVEYPNSELVIEIYSLSTKKEFVGV